MWHQNSAPCTVRETVPLLHGFDAALQKGTIYQYGITRGNVLAPIFYEYMLWSGGWSESIRGLFGGTQLPSTTLSEKNVTMIGPLSPSEFWASST